MNLAMIANNNSGVTSARSQKNVVTHDMERINILVVDDLPEKLIVYRSILEELGQNLITANSGEEALKQVLKHEFAVILLDVNMPGIDGFETATMIRQRKKSAHTPIIFLTAFTDDVLMAQGYASGAVDYLPTPVIPAVLQAKVKVFIELFQTRRQAALQAEESAKRKVAEEADRRKDEFLGMLAHELRNPLGPIRNAVQLLQLIGPKEPRMQELRDIIDRQASHMGRLIDDLLDTTRLARGQISLRKEPCDLTKIVNQTAEDYRNIFDASDLKMQIDTPKNSIWIDGDPTRLVQSIGNLLHNAHKFTEPGGTITVSLKYVENCKWAVVSIHDTGIGIPSNVLPHVFEVFHQAEQGLDRRRGCLGLGLSLVKGLVELHNGTVSVNSEPGKGSEFVLRFPVVEVPEKVSESCEIIKLNKKAAKCRILVIEDNLDAAESAKMFLKLEGYTVKIANSGLSGLEIAKSFLPQIILCDIGLPVMDGYQIARTIRQDPVLCSSYIIAMTGYGRNEDQKQAQKAGFDMHLIKPVDYNVLRRTLKNVAARV